MYRVDFRDVIITGIIMCHFYSTNLVLHQSCSAYTWLTESSRYEKYGNRESNCDDQLSGWYRFGGEAGKKIATTCPAENSCGTDGPGWMNGAHPTVSDGEVSMQACFRYSGNCCQFRYDIKVVNCGQYYVYNLSPTGCNLRYCGSEK